ncbi:MAG: PAS domain S-box protein [Betaproteobacteria bacterium]|nr:PAS domain S-box protein [Betaproteobacteria bacterium]
MWASFPASAIALIYAALAGLWIVLSATVLAFSSADPVQQGRIEVVKGLVFVITTSGLLYLLLRARQAPQGGAEAGAGHDPPAAEGRQWLSLLVVIALGVPLFGLAVYALHAGKDERDGLNNLSAVARLKATQIEDWLAERRGDGLALAASHGFVERVEQILRTGDAREREFVSNRLEGLQHPYSYDAVQLLDSSARPLLAVGEPHALSEATRALFPAALASGKVQSGTLLRDAAGHLHLDFVVPLLPRERGSPEPAGIAILHVSPERFLFPLIQSWPTTSASGEVFLVRREGDSLVFLNDLRHRTGDALPPRYPLTGSTMIAVAAVTANGSGTIKGVDYRGVPVLGAYRPIAGTDWVLVAKVDLVEAMASARDTALWAGAIALIALLVVGAAMLVLWRTRRRADRLEVQAEADRFFRLFYDLPFIGMAITSPATKRWVKFNDQLCDILGYSREELGAMNWAEVTHPEDLDNDVAEFERVLRGETEGYVMEKRFIRKDGAIVHGAIDVKCARRPDGTVDYFVATVQDITGRKAAEATILRLNRVYATLSRCNEAIVRCTGENELFVEICRAAVESGGMKMATVGIIDGQGVGRAVASAGEGTEYFDGIRISVDAGDPFGRGPIGTAIRENRAVWCQDFPNDPMMAPWRELGAQYGWGSVAALPLRRGGAPIGALTLYSAQPHEFDDQTQRLLSDMAADVSFALDNFQREARHKEAEVAVRESEERYRNLFESSLDGILLGAPDGSVLAANPAACRMFGRTLEELREAGRTGVADISDPRYPAAVAERQRTGHFRGELTVLRKNGDKFPVEVSSTVFKDHAGHERTSMFVRDVSERKKVEAQLLDQLEELRRWHAAMLGREERVLALKLEVNQFLKQSGLPPRYPSAEVDTGTLRPR